MKFLDNISSKIYRFGLLKDRQDPNKYFVVTFSSWAEKIFFQWSSKYPVIEDLNAFIDRINIAFKHHPAPN